MGDEHIFGSMLLPFLIGMYAVHGVASGQHGLPMLTAMAALFGLMAMTGDVEVTVWICIGFGGFMGFLAAETGRLAARPGAD
ncbi:MAG: hypothetical protein AAFR52_11225 [Pseudomonadota bacterium]